MARFSGKITKKELVPFAIELKVKNLEKSIRYYVDVLGFELIRRDEGFASLMFEKSLVMLQEKKTFFPRKTSFEIRILLKAGLRKHFNKLKRKGAVIWRPLVVEEYGLTTFFVKDLDGYLIRYCEKTR